MADKTFATEADLVAAFCAAIPKREAWTQYHETAGWDVLLVGKDGIQVGIEAKLALNTKALDQALPGRWVDERGPDYRAVLVPRYGVQNHLGSIARHVGIVVIGFLDNGCAQFQPSLPDESYEYGLRDWPNWCPAERCKLPDYIPDVTGGHSAPVALTDWKVRAIKLLILLERRGVVTRADMKALKISPTRWTDHWHGFLAPGPHGGYVRCARTPDLKAQHPINWPEIEADFDQWSKGIVSAAPLLIGSAA